MAYFVDRVVICDAYEEPERFYELMPGGRTQLVEGRRRPSMRLKFASDVGGTRTLENLLGDQTTLDGSSETPNRELNDFVNGLREEVREWRNGTGKWAGRPYGGVSEVTKELLYWWFCRRDERKPQGKRFFFCQREAIETLIYLFEAKSGYKMPETGSLLRYAMKMATGTGKTVVMALAIVWSSMHHARVSGSPLSENFLVIVPNLTVRDRVRGTPRGDGLDPSGKSNLYKEYEMIPPQYSSVFHPNVLVKNWQSVRLMDERDDWTRDDAGDGGRFIPASVQWAATRRAQRDPTSPIRRAIKGWRDLVIINDEAHHVYGEKRTRRGEEPDYIRWNKIIELISKVSKICLCADLSATPWYGSGSTKPEGTLFEWLISDFSVYDAFESGLVKVVRLPEEKGGGRAYLDIWDMVKGAKTQGEYISACKGAIASIYSSWKAEYNWWKASKGPSKGPSPVMLIVTSDARKAFWVFDHITREYPLLRNTNPDDPKSFVTLQIDSHVFDADEGLELVLREMVNTVGRSGMPGEKVRCIVCVNMLSEGWDVKNVTHILGIRAFGSDLLTEQVIGRGLRLTNYDVLNQPLVERPTGYEETVDAFGIPFIGFPIQRRKRAAAGDWGNKPNWIQADPRKTAFALEIPHVRSWAVGINRPLSELVKTGDMATLVVDSKHTPSDIRVRPVVGGKPEDVLTLDEFRKDFPLMRTAFMVAEELFERTNPGVASSTGMGPSFDELLDFARSYIEAKLQVRGSADPRDVGIHYWRLQVVDLLENTIRSVGVVDAKPVPIHADPPFLRSAEMRPFQWSGVIAEGKRSHLSLVACHNDFEKRFADFLDGASDVERFIKNERLGFSITYYQMTRPRQYFPDFVVVTDSSRGKKTNWLVETKGEKHEDTILKSQAAQQWCAKLSGDKYGTWRYLLVPQREFERAIGKGIDSMAKLSTLVTGTA
ncbi:MAG: DEAD/DEAH box helicase family protein [Nitrososphaerota archaeon]|jgi:type III restriction enzyme|nr:DEAD/DEAH box helicase family protein [Nitrososphaerota archaeon]